MIVQSVRFVSSSISASVPAGAINDLDASVRADLARISDTFFFWVAISAIFVAIGCILEGPEVLHEIFPSLFSWFTWSSRDRRDKFERKIKAIGLVGWLLVVLGVAAEGVFEVYDHQASGLLQTFDELLLTTTQRQTSEAYERAGSAQLLADSFESQIADSTARTKVAEAKVALAEAESKGAAAKVATADARIAEAQRRAAEADALSAQLGKDAEDERLARVKIESDVAFRQLTPTQKESLGNALARFKGLVGISFWYQASDIEAELFADDIAEALRAKGAIVQPPANILSMRATGKYGDPVVGADTGVTVQSTNVGAAPEFANAIIGELNSLGFDAKRQTDPPFDKDTHPQVWVNVDARPRGAQGEYKLHPISKK